VRVVLLDTARTVVIGRVPGVLASVYAGKWLSSVVLVNADPTAVLSAVVALFFAAALVAASGPAWRASRVDPVVALRTP
jgi:ABC-type lipoprotein release transport system permease subunit